MAPPVVGTVAQNCHPAYIGRPRSRYSRSICFAAVAEPVQIGDAGAADRCADLSPVVPKAVWFDVEYLVMVEQRIAIEAFLRRRPGRATATNRIRLADRERDQIIELGIRILAAARDNAEYESYRILVEAHRHAHELLDDARSETDQVLKWVRAGSEPPASQPPASQPAVSSRGESGAPVPSAPRADPAFHDEADDFWASFDLPGEDRWAFLDDADPVGSGVMRRLFHRSHPREQPSDLPSTEQKVAI